MRCSTSCWRPGFLEEVARKALLLKQRLAELKDRHPGVIAEIRGDGLLIGLRLEMSNTDFTRAARAENLLVVPAGDNTVRLLPPLIITDADSRRGDPPARRGRDARRRGHPSPGGGVRPVPCLLPAMSLPRHFLDLSEFHREGSERAPRARSAP